MPLQPGTRLGDYEILAVLGAGGMGEVYRARDTRLGREVAVKLLLRDVAGAPDLLGRFEREARVLASLNHPHIATLHGFFTAVPAAGDGVPRPEEQPAGNHAGAAASVTVRATAPGRPRDHAGEATAFLVMELVEGPTLADRIRERPLAVDEALTLFRRIAEGLEAAHASGVVHRDLKPANIKASEDRVKILDFGLAKAMQREASPGSDPALTRSPTLTLAATQRGEILGTAAYMSPEQARGLPVDRRADVWAFGVCLYESLAGRRAFDGGDVTEILAAVIRDTPDLDALPAATPPAIRRLLRRCLEKDPRRRLRDIGDAIVEIDDAVRGVGDPAPPGLATGSTAPSRPWWRRVLPVAAGVGAGAVLVSALGLWRAAPTPPPQVSRLSLELETQPIGGLAISPDGTQIVYSPVPPSAGIYRRPIAELGATLVAGSESLRATFLRLSPDGRWIAFASGRGNTEVMRIPVSGGAAEMLITDERPIAGLAWEGDALLVATDDGILRLAASGGTAERILSVAEGELATTPRLLPGGEWLLFTLGRRTSVGGWGDLQVAVHSLRSGERRVLFPGTDARYLETGDLIFAREGAWYRLAFDPVKAEAGAGAARPLLQGVARYRVSGLFTPEAVAAISQTGTLVYQAGPVSIGNDREIVLTERGGEPRVLPIAVRPYEAPRVSPDGRQLALSSRDDEQDAIWIYDLSEQTALRRLTFDASSRLPVWAPDSRRLAYWREVDGEAGIFVRPADGSGSPERFTTAEPGTLHLPESWSSDGRHLSYSRLTGEGAELWLHDTETGRDEAFGDVREPYPLNSAFSPDGRWIAYTSRTGYVSGIGGAAIFLQPVPATGARYEITDNRTSHHPFWNPAGGELFFFGANSGRSLTSVRITLQPTVRWDPPVVEPGFHDSNTTPLSPLHYDMTPDGRAFVFANPLGAESLVEPQAGQRLVVVQNWLEELRRESPAG